MDLRIGIASFNLATGFPATVYALIKKHLPPGHVAAECAMGLARTPEHLRTRLLALLEATPRPRALVGICIRPDAATIAAYRAAGVPVVLVDEEAEGASTVACHNFAGGLLAARHLVQAGRRTIALVSGETQTEGGYNARRRVQGFKQGLSEAGLTVPPERALEVHDYSRKDGTDAMARLLDARAPLDAVFCAAGDLCATGMLATAAARGVRVPAQIAVLGYDDQPAAASAAPPLSTVRQPIDRIAREVCQLSAGDAAALVERPRKVLLEPELVVRASTARA